MIADKCPHIPLRCFNGVTPRTSAPPRSHSGAGVLIAARLGAHRIDRTPSHHIQCDVIRTEKPMHQTHSANCLSSCVVQKRGGVSALASSVTDRHTTAQSFSLSSRRQTPATVTTPEAVSTARGLLDCPVPGTVVDDGRRSSRRGASRKTSASGASPSLDVRGIPARLALRAGSRQPASGPRLDEGGHVLRRVDGPRRQGSTGAQPRAAVAAIHRMDRAVHSSSRVAVLTSLLNPYLTRFPVGASSTVPDASPSVTSDRPAERDTRSVSSGAGPGAPRSSPRVGCARPAHDSCKSRTS